MTCTMMSPMECFGVHYVDHYALNMAADALTMGFGVQYGLDIAKLVAAEDLKKALGLQLVASPTDDFKKVVAVDSTVKGNDDMMEKLVLAEPRKVQLEALSYSSPVSSVSSEGKLAPEFSPPPGLSAVNMVPPTVIIFNWDDTLLCTSWLSRHMGQPPSVELDHHLRKIAQRLLSILENALRMGHTYIITNSVTGWVEFSAAIWVPELLPVLRRVQIISARDTYQHVYPEDPSQWKFQAFLGVRRQLLSMPIENLVVLGDGDFEMDAAQAMESEFPNANIKTVKFQPQPTAKEHLRQVEVVADKFERIVKKPRSLKVFLEKKGAVAQQ